MKWELIFTLIGSLATAGSTYLAYRVIRENYQQRNDMLHLKNAILCLERAYSALTHDGKHTYPPLKDRLAWLTTARLIEEFKRFKSEVKDETLRLEIYSHEEHWRLKLYKALSHQNIQQSGNYYSSGKMDVNAIEPRSAVIIHSFADWPASQKDPIDEYEDTKDALKKLKPSNRWLGLRQLTGIWT